MTMKSLLDEILDSLPVLVSRHEGGPTAGDISGYLCADMGSVRSAMSAMDEAGRARIVRRGRALHLVPSDYPGFICPVCRAEFVRPKKSKRRTCSRRCANAWSWQQPETRERRRTAISEQRKSPEGRANTAERNRRLWADPKQHERLSKWNKDRWEDPYVKAELSVAIQKAQLTPERREFQRKQIKDRWDDDEGREKMLNGIRKSKQSPEARAKFSELLRERWKDPVWREKYTAANRARSLEIAKSNRGKKQSPEHVAKRVKAFKETMSKRKAND